MKEGEKTKVIVIVGPTGSGKTSLAIDLAKRFSGEVISADSRQVYRKLDIGTEKVTKEEMGAVPHHLIDVCDVDEVYSAERFKNDAAKAILDITSRGNIPIIAGGTFFYVDALLGNVTMPTVPPDSALRTYLEDLSTETLYARLEQLDPERAFSIDKDNKRRLVRALEVVESLGKVPKPIAGETKYDVLKLGIEVDKAVLRTRLRARAAKALERGLIEETKSLLDTGVSVDRLSEIGLEYRLVIEYLNGGMSNEELLQRLEEKNWQYAKRQFTWLKRDTDIRWLPISERTSIEVGTAEFLAR